MFPMDDEKIISEVKEHPCFYKTKIADYKISLNKENAWKTVAAVVGQNITGNLFRTCNA